jgi:cytoskeletal protein CcmA (bactofilin family)
MRNFKKILLSLPLLLLLTTISLLSPTNVEAAKFEFKSYVLTSDQTIDEDLYVVADDIKVDGVVDGDVILVGDSVQLNGTITGDAYILGTTVNIDSNVYGNIFVFGNNTNIEGLVTDNTYIVSSFLDYQADTQRDMLAIFFDGTLKGSVGDDLRAIGIKPNIESIIRGDLVLIGEQENLTETTVTGEIYDSNRLNRIAESQGVDMEETPSFDIETTWESRTLSLTINFLSFLLVGFILISISPVKTYKIQEKITGSTNEFLKSLAVGFIVFMLLPIPLFILAISVVGTPAAILIGGLLFFLMFFGKVWVETALGKEILALLKIEGYRPFKSFLAGRVLTILVNIIPIVRGFYNMILSFVALGAVIRMKTGYYQLANKQAKEYREKNKSTKKKTTKKATKSSKKKTTTKKK